MSLLDSDQIPIERQWEMSMRLHDALGHTDPWEICSDGCYTLADDMIRLLFNLEKPQ